MSLHRGYPVRKSFRRVSGLFAFWRYDIFPYVLGGPVMAMNDKGHVQIETYGGGVYVPIKIVTREAGKKILAQIEQLRKEYRVAEKAFHTGWRNKIVALVPEVRDP